MSDARIEVHQRPDGAVEWVRLVDGTTTAYLPHRVGDVLLKDRERMGLPDWAWKMLKHMLEFEDIHPQFFREDPFLRNGETSYSVTPCGIATALDYVPKEILTAVKDGMNP